MGIQSLPYTARALKPRKVSWLPKVHRLKETLILLLGSFNFQSSVLFVTQCLCSECKDCPPIHPDLGVISCRPCCMRMERWWKGCSHSLSPYSLLRCGPLIHSLQLTGTPPPICKQNILESDRSGFQSQLCCLPALEN